MRAMFGLVALLVTTAVIIYSFTKTEIPVLKKGEETRQQAQQLAGRDTDGTPVAQTFKVTPQFKGGRLASMQLDQITAGSAMQQYYGLQQGDQIVQVGTMDMELMNNDSGLAEAEIQEAYQRQQPLGVVRGGTKLTLPNADTSTAQQQLNSIKIPTH